MYGFLFLLCSFGILTVQAENNSLDDLSTTQPKTAPPEASSLMTNQSSSKLTTSSPIPSTSLRNKQSTATTSTTTTTPKSIIQKFEECFLCFSVAGGLIVACAVLLISTLTLACKVCQLSRRLRRLSINSDLISNSEYKIGTAEKDKDKCEQEVKETSMLMSDMGQAQEDMGNGTAKEEAGKANEEEQTGEENKKEVEGTATDEEAPTVTAAEAPSTSQPQEDTTNSQPSAVAAPSEEVAKEPEDVV
ncbi:uncharacterized protein LOC113169113 [Anabas testudineus]|uniref:uncharacterized protein LOC113169113 n=1 Tax=Anabas testudineus TaxID=64144 RepID=UPI000E46303B|nr:uncharacterized protein LOC113169113 [Anabas testudineus]